MKPSPSPEELNSIFEEAQYIFPNKLNYQDGFIIARLEEATRTKLMNSAIQTLLSDIESLDDQNIHSETFQQLCKKMFETKDLVQSLLIHGSSEIEPDSSHLLFNHYNRIKALIGELGYNAFIHSKEVEEYRAWLRNDKYKHRIDWFENQFPNGLYYRDDEGNEWGICIITKQFLAESDAAYGATETEKV